MKMHINQNKNHYLHQKKLFFGFNPQSDQKEEAVEINETDQWLLE